MPVELAELVTGLPLAASFAMTTGISLLRAGRRRSSLNEAMHELRRPLQILALSLPADPRRAEAVGSALRMATAAAERLDSEINGGAPVAATERIAVREIVAVAGERWRPVAAARGRSLCLAGGVGDLTVRGDGTELAQALDNLISNALEHGGGEVAIEVGAEEGCLRLAVRDRGAKVGPGRLGRLRRRRRGGHRHGHGLRVVRRAAARHGGSFRLRRAEGGTEARLDLPLAGAAR
jgi:signal transduction histidine kinase